MAGFVAPPHRRNRLSIAAVIGRHLPSSFPRAVANASVTRRDNDGTHVWRCPCSSCLGGPHAALARDVALVAASTLLSPVPDADKKKKTKTKKTAEDEDGFKVFKSMCKNVVQFTGTHRFLDTELPALLEIMQTPGGKAVPHALRKAVLGRIQAGPDDPRLGQDFAVDGRSGFFAFGAFAAIRWEQVARMTQLHILQMASKSTGPVAACNKADGKHDLHRTVPGQRQGQLVYYFTAVDRFKHNHYNRDRDTRLRALAFVNLSKSGGLPGMCGTFLGMRVRLTRKVQPETPSILSLHSCTHF